MVQPVDGSQGKFLVLLFAREGVVGKSAVSQAASDSDPLGLGVPTRADPIITDPQIYKYLMCSKSPLSG